MIKKHFIFGANYIVRNYQQSGTQGDFRRLSSYKTCVALFCEFGNAFSLQKFDNYIEEKLENIITYEDIDRL